MRGAFGAGKSGKRAFLYSFRLVKDFELDVFGLIRGNDYGKECLELNITEDEVFMHLDARGCVCFSVEVTSTGEVVETRLQGELVVGVLVVLSAFMDDGVHFISKRRSRNGSWCLISTSTDH